MVGCVERKLDTAYFFGDFVRNTSEILQKGFHMFALTFVMVFFLAMAILAQCIKMAKIDGEERTYTKVGILINSLYIVGIIYLYQN